MNEYKDRHLAKFPRVYRENSIYLRPGEYCFAKEPTLIHTILGSCVSVVLFDQSHQYGAMCHAVLDSKSTTADEDVSHCSKYMDCVLDEMIAAFAQNGVSVKSLTAKVFGGSQMLLDQEKPFTSPGRVGVGEKNAQMALSILKEYGCRIELTDLGGHEGRKIFFLSHTRDVYLKRIKKGMQQP